MVARLLALLALAWAVPVAAQEHPAMDASTASDPELAAMTGKFLLPGGGSLALSITSDTMVNGALVLRTVLTVDQGSTLSVFGRDAASAGDASAASASSGTTAGSATKLDTGVSVLFDRRTGTQIVMPTVSTVRNGTVSSPAEAGVVQLALTPGGPAIATADGAVTLKTLPNGSQVTLAADQLDISHLVGQAVATAVLNAGNDRTIDTVTTIGIDVHDAATLAMGAAAMKVEALVSDVARGMVR